MSWIIKAAGCYLGNKDKLEDEAKAAHRFHYKQEALDHAVTWSLFNQWADGREVDMKVLPYPPKK